MKTVDLEGPALEYWFNRATGNWPADQSISFAEYVEYGGMPEMFGWADVGPIIDKHGIALAPLAQLQQGGEGWAATGLQMRGDDFTVWGKTPLIAAMRCVVLAKFGEDIES